MKNIHFNEVRTIFGTGYKFECDRFGGKIENNMEGIERILDCPSKNSCLGVDREECPHTGERFHHRISNLTYDWRNCRDARAMFESHVNNFDPWFTVPQFLNEKIYTRKTKCDRCEYCVIFKTSRELKMWLVKNFGKNPNTYPEKLPANFKNSFFPKDRFSIDEDLYIDIPLVFGGYN